MPSNPAPAVRQRSRTRRPGAGRWIRVRSGRTRHGRRSGRCRSRRASSRARKFDRVASPWASTSTAILNLPWSPVSAATAATSRSAAARSVVGLAMARIRTSAASSWSAVVAGAWPRPVSRTIRPKTGYSSANGLPFHPISSHGRLSVVSSTSSRSAVGRRLRQVSRAGVAQEALPQLAAQLVDRSQR